MLIKGEVDMIKEIIKDQFILSQKSLPAGKDDLVVVQDLLDTMKAHDDICVGMAANMIGVLKNIIVVKDMENSEKIYIIINPEIVKVFGQPYKCNESCLCYDIDKTKETKRYSKIKIKYVDENWKIKMKTFKGVTAQIVQHEMDHCKGILI